MNITDNKKESNQTEQNMKRESIPIGKKEIPLYTVMGSYFFMDLQETYLPD